MPGLLDTVNKQLSTSVEFERGMAAYFASSADTKQRALDACNAMAAERDDYKQKYEDMCDMCDDLRTQLAEAKALIAQLTQKPIVNVSLKGKAKIGKLVTGNLNELYAKDDNNKGQSHRRIGIGG